MWCLLSFYFFIRLSLSDEIPCQEQYTDWIVIEPCTAECGRCGLELSVRSCFEECECNGPFYRNITCPKRHCLHPKPACCEGFVRVVNPATKRYECASPAEKQQLVDDKKKNRAEDL
ncbi:unnamed protein product, partial [Mesorhabditis spiculigera]